MLWHNVITRVGSGTTRDSVLAACLLSHHAAAKLVPVADRLLEGDCTTLEAAALSVHLVCARAYLCY